MNNFQFQYTLLLVLLLLATPFGLAQSDSVTLSCGDRATTWLQITIIPSFSNCDISYNDNCGKLTGTFNLKANLDNLNAPSNERYIDSFSIPSGSAIHIDQENFEIRFPDRVSGPNIPVYIESLVNQQGPKLIYCNPT